ncbi:MAG: hypothetical protein K2X27_27600 [Candidatus Obscuribacterales bacterium]|nr:hypothetical protein [Candidatus Obscuribacterales bacterium]
MSQRGPGMARPGRYSLLHERRRSKQKGMEDWTMNIEQEAQKLENLSVNHHGDAALKELQSLSKEERLEVIKKMQKDARDEGGKVYIDKDQLVFDSPYAQMHKNY